MKQFKDFKGFKKGIKEEQYNIYDVLIYTIKRTFTLNHMPSMLKTALLMFIVSSRSVMNYRNNKF